MTSLRISDFPIGYRGFTFNTHRSTAGAYLVASERDTTVVQSFDISPIQFRDQREALHGQTGGDFGVGNEVFRFTTLVGKIKSSSGEKLEDVIGTLGRLGSLDEAMYDFPSLMGVSAIDFYCPTEVSATGISSPVRELLYGRPAGPLAWGERSQDGLTAIFSLGLVCADPRRYLYTATSVSLASGTFSNRTLPNWTATQGRKVYPVVTLTMSGNGSATLTLTDAATSTALILDMSAAGSGTFTIDMATGIIKKSSTKRADLRTSAVDTFWGIPAGGTTVTITGTTNITTAVFAYRQARV